MDIEFKECRINSNKIIHDNKNEKWVISDQNVYPLIIFFTLAYCINLSNNKLFQSQLQSKVMKIKYKVIVILRVLFRCYQNLHGIHKNFFLSSEHVIIFHLYGTWPQFTKYSGLRKSTMSLMRSILITFYCFIIDSNSFYYINAMYEAQQSLLK